MQAMVTKIMQQSKIIMVTYFVKGVNEFFMWELAVFLFSGYDK